MTPIEQFMAGVISVTFQSSSLVLVTHREHDADFTVLCMVHIGYDRDQMHNIEKRKIADVHVANAADPYNYGVDIGTRLVNILMGID